MSCVIGIVAKANGALRESGSKIIALDATPTYDLTDAPATQTTLNIVNASALGGDLKQSAVATNYTRRGNVDTSNLVIIPDWKSDSSPTGLSFYSRAQGGCPYRAVLDKKYKDLLHEMELESGEATALSIGSAFHKILEHYYKGTLDSVAFDSDNPSVAEALRLFGGYRARFPREEFGGVVGAEVEFSLLGDDARNLFGVDAFTGRIDLVVEVTEANIERLESFEGRNLSGLRPGLYALDHKTMKQRCEPAKWHNDFQFHAYPIAWNFLYPNRPILGMIANCVVRHKTLSDNSYFSTMVPLATPTQHAALKAHLSDSEQIYQLRGREFKNRTACFNYNQTCPHFTTGACDRV